MANYKQTRERLYWGFVEVPPDPTPPKLTLAHKSQVIITNIASLQSYDECDFSRIKNTYSIL